LDIFVKRLKFFVHTKCYLVLREKVVLWVVLWEKFVLWVVLWEKVVLWIVLWEKVVLWGCPLVGLSSGLSFGLSSERIFFPKTLYTPFLDYDKNFISFSIVYF